MTCREFQDAAASLMLRELSEGLDASLSRHADNCHGCGAWLQKQQSLADNLATLRLRTAGLEAGPQVEGQLLRAFRRSTVPVVTVPEVSRSWPFSLRLSRWFEVSAYAAVAAAVVLVVFLGIELVRHPAKSAVQEQASQVPPAAVGQQAHAVQPAGAAKSVAPVSSVLPPAHLSRKASQGSTVGQSQTSDDDDYVALMLCDPLSCSSDGQVVRLELPASPGAEAQASRQMADVVVGEDGVVRAVRMVN